MSNLDAFNDEEVVTENQQQIYTGLAKVKPVLVNPSMEQLQEIGVNLNSAPSYVDEVVDDKSGEEFTRIRYDVWFKLPVKDDTHSKLSFFVENRDFVASTGKVKVMNDYGQAVFVEPDQKASELYEWYKSDGEHRVFRGEEDLVNFIRAYGNIKSDDKFNIDLSDDLENGNWKTFQEVIEHIRDNLGNTVEVLLGAKDGKYQAVYTRMFGKGNVNNTGRFKNHIEKQMDYLSNNGYSFPVDFQGSLKFQKYEPTAEMEAFGSDSSDSDNQEMDDEELPF